MDIERMGQTAPHAIGAQLGLIDLCGTLLAKGVIDESEFERIRHVALSQFDEVETASDEARKALDAGRASIDAMWHHRLQDCARKRPDRP